MAGCQMDSVRKSGLKKVDQGRAAGTAKRRGSKAEAADQLAARRPLFSRPRAPRQGQGLRR